MMLLNQRSPVRALTLVFAMGSAFAIAADTPSGTSHTAATELDWGASGFGPEVSPIHVDPAKKAHVTYVKFEAGMATPLHTHTHDYVGIVITGVTMHWEPGKPETRKALSAGAHWFMPGNVRHVSECLPGAECIMAIAQQQPMDFLPVEQ